MADKVYYKTVISEENGQRLDNYLIRVLKGVPKSHIYRLIRGGEVRVNKKRAKVSSRLTEGDLVRIPPVRVSADAGPIVVNKALFERLNESIIFEDERLLVINKPTGMAVHGGSGLRFGVIEAFRAMRPEARYLELIHRLDRETSGCLLIAKKRSMLRQVQALFEARQVQKTYWLLAQGAWTLQQTVRVNLPLHKNTLQSGERMVRVDDAGKPSQTTFKCLEKYRDACWLEANPKTGRTHQIRVHVASQKHPIIGDLKYGAAALSPELKKSLGKRLYLHARTIQFTLDETPYIFKAELDAQFDDAIQFFRENQKTV
ncbi:MAG: RluA family pseudouridine synthase [Gammaproteobacteria bacterium]|nr:RluA family pseudouridine synthase [Gammaproteobacteria bacterium]